MIKNKEKIVATSGTKKRFQVNHKGFTKLNEKDFH